MDSLDFQLAPLCPTLLHHVGGLPLKRPYSRLWGSPPQDGPPSAIFYPFRHPTPHAYASTSHSSSHPPSPASTSLLSLAEADGRRISGSLPFAHHIFVRDEVRPAVRPRRPSPLRTSSTAVSPHMSVGEAPPRKLGPRACPGSSGTSPGGGVVFLGASRLAPRAEPREARFSPVASFAARLCFPSARSEGGRSGDRQTGAT
jgi:hypothetical protein